ncbi:hypothetical protein CS542_06655 [Pedobacter sp. IW39]|nr:hypothetical protein CS542_06655 [Pedobacter sp. IW39]
MKAYRSKNVSCFHFSVTSDKLCFPLLSLLILFHAMLTTVHRNRYLNKNIPNLADPCYRKVYKNLKTTLFTNK